MAETLFLKRVGVDRLPWVFLVNSILLTGTTLAAGRLAIRHERRRLLTATLGLLGLALLPLWILVLGGVSTAIALLVLMAKQLDAIAMVVFWTAIGGLVSGRQGKRLFARISAGGTLGAIAGSFASGWLGRVFGIATLLPIATIAMLLAALAVLPLTRIRQPHFYRAVPPPGLDDAANWRLRPLWRGGALFRVLVLVSLLAGMLGPILYFEFAYVADLATQGSGGEQRLLDLYAIFRGWLNVGVLLIQIVGTPAVFRRLGVPLAAALSPLIYLVGLAGLSLQLSLAAGVAAVAGANLQDHAVYDPAQRILVTLFPERMRAAVTTLIDGPVKRTGSVLGNVIIIGALAAASPFWVGFAGLPIATAWLLLALVLWRLYPSLLMQIASTRRNDLEEPPPLTELLDGGTVRLLEHGLVSSDLERCRAACELIVEAIPRRGVRALARALRVAPPGNHPLLVATLQRVLDSPAGETLVLEEAALHLGALLSAPSALDVLERAQLVRAYGRLRGLAAKARPAPLAAAAEDQSPAVRLAAIAALARAGAVPIAELDAAVSAAIESGDEVARRIAREEIARELRRPASGGARWDSRLGLLVAQLADPAERSHAAAAIAAVAAVQGTRLAPCAPTLLAHRTDPDPAVRSAVLRFAGAVRLAESARWIVPHLIADDPDEAAAARQALRDLGPAAVDVLLHTLRFGGYRVRQAALTILIDMPIEPTTLNGLVESELDRIRQQLLLVHALREGGVAEVVLQRLHERIDEAAHTTVMLFAALYDDDRLARAARLLGHAHSGRDRGLVLEALEALLPPEERTRLLPLLEEGDPRLLAKTAAAALERPLPSFDAAVAEALASNDTLTHDLLRATLPADVLARQPAVDPAHAFVPYQRRGHAVTNVDVMLHLRRLDLFAGLTTRELAELTRVIEERNVTSGEVIVHEDEFDDQMYFIVTGRVRITKGGEDVTTLGEGEFFGEIAVLDGEERSASATADGAVHLLRLTRQDLFEVMEEHPHIAIAICQTLSRRIRNLLEERHEAVLAAARKPPDDDGR